RIVLPRIVTSNDADELLHQGRWGYSTAPARRERQPSGCVIGGLISRWDDFLICEVRVARNRRGLQWDSTRRRNVGRRSVNQSWLIRYRAQVGGIRLARWPDS